MRSPRNAFVAVFALALIVAFAAPRGAAAQDDGSPPRGVRPTAAQVRKALDNLEMTGRVHRHRSKAGTRIELLKFK